LPNFTEKDWEIVWEENYYPQLGCSENLCNVLGIKLEYEGREWWNYVYFTTNVKPGDEAFKYGVEMLKDSILEGIRQSA
jgi:hypothetical protein